MPLREGTRRRTQRLLGNAEMRIDRGPQPLKPLDLSRELLRFERHAEELLRLGLGCGDNVREERPYRGQFLGLDLARSDLQQTLAGGFRRGGRLIALPNADAEDDDLPELRFDGPEHPQILEVPRKPPHDLGVERVVRDDEHQHAAILQKRQAALIEHLLQARTPLELVAIDAVVVPGQIAIGRVEPHHAERLA